MIDPEDNKRQNSLLNLFEAADFLGLHVQDILRLVSRMKLNPTKKNKVLYFSSEELSNWNNLHGTDYIRFCDRKKEVHHD